MAEVSGLVENIQEVCALIRADATELAALSLADSPRKQANEVISSLLRDTSDQSLCYTLHIVHRTLLFVGLFLVCESPILTSSEWCCRHGLIAW